MSTDNTKGFSCSLCPRKCSAERGEKSGRGYCASPALPVVTRAAPHFGEEPCISGPGGSGTVFFAGCNLRCVFCQNRNISGGGTDKGKILSPTALRELFYRLEDKGVCNINLVTPSHFIIPIAEALAGASLHIPVVWNSSGYEGVNALRSLRGLVDIYIPDYKYSDKALAEEYSKAPDYPLVAAEAIAEMYAQTGPFVQDENGLAKKGVIVRHLVLPGSVDNTLGVIDIMERLLPPDGFYFSLMSQYTPMPGLENHPKLRRTVTEEEYDGCLSYLMMSDIENIFAQDGSSKGSEMIPDFDGTGL